jgi:hypothetical protein
MVMRAAQREPEITSLMRTADDAALRQPALRDALAPAWPDIQAAAAKRRRRVGLPDDEPDEAAEPGGQAVDTERCQ